MISKILDFCLRERLVVLALALAVIGYGWYSTQKVPARCDSQRGREPGDRAHRMDGPFAQGHGRPDHLSAVGRFAGRARLEKRARQEHVRLQLRAGDVRRQRRLLLGALPRGGATDDRFRLAARWRDAHARARCHGAGADLLLRARTARGHGPGGAAVQAGFLHQVCAAIGRRRGRGRFDRRLCSAVSNRSRSRQAPLSRHSAEPGHRRGESLEHRCGRQDRRIGRHGVHRAGQRLHRLRQDRTGNHRADREHGRRSPATACRCESKTWPKFRSVPRFGAGLWI